MIDSIRNSSQNTENLPSSLACHTYLCAIPTLTRCAQIITSTNATTIQRGNRKADDHGATDLHEQSPRTYSLRMHSVKNRKYAILSAQWPRCYTPNTEYLRGTQYLKLRCMLGADSVMECPLPTVFHPSWKAYRKMHLLGRVRRVILKITSGQKSASQP